MFYQDDWSGKYMKDKCDDRNIKLEYTPDEVSILSNYNS